MVRIKTSLNKVHTVGEENFSYKWTWHYRIRYRIACIWQTVNGKSSDVEEHERYAQTMVQGQCTIGEHTIEHQQIELFIQ
jgi:hypothetical protein